MDISERKMCSNSTEAENVKEKKEERKKREIRIPEEKEEKK